MAFGGIVAVACYCYDESQQLARLLPDDNKHLYSILAST